MLALLADTSVRVLLLGATGWVVVQVLRVRNPHLERLVWRSILVAGIALPALLYWRVAPMLDMSLPALTGTAKAAGPLPAFAPRDASLMAVLGAIYLGVAAVLLAGFVIGLARMRRLCRLADPLPSATDVRISAQVRIPATFGATVLLPEGARSWRAPELAAVLAHERAHVRWHDCRWLWLAQLYIVVFWFNPFAWWLRARLAALAEATSDDAVLAADQDHVAYAELLLLFARQPNPGRVAMSASGPKISERIERVLSRTPPSMPPPRLAGVLVAALLIPVTVFVAATTRAAPPADPNALPPLAERVMGMIRSAANPDDYYPATAKHERVTGYAVVEVDVDALGQLVDARVLEVEPTYPRFGFADAALQVARNTKYGAPYQQPSTFKFKVKFALTDQ